MSTPNPSRLVVLPLLLLLCSAGDGAAQLPTVVAPPPGVLTNPTRPVLDGAGNLYVGGRTSGTVLRVAPDGTTTLLADRTDLGGTGGPEVLGVDSQGVVWTTNLSTDSVYRIDPDGTVTVALGPDGDGMGQTLDFPNTMAIDALDQVWVVGLSSKNVWLIEPDGDARVVLDLSTFCCTPNEKISSEGGQVILYSRYSVFRCHLDGSVVQVLDSTGDGVTPVNFITDIAADDQGNLYANGNGGNVFKVDAQDQVSVFYTTSGGIPEVAASTAHVYLITSDTAGWNVVEIPAAGGPGVTRFTSSTLLGLGVDATGHASWVQPQSVASDWVWRIGPTTRGSAVKVLGQFGDGMGNFADGALAPAIAPDGTLYLSGVTSQNVLEVTPAGGVREIVDALAFQEGILGAPEDVAADRFGRLIAAGSGSHDVLRFDDDAPTAELLVDASGDGLGHPLTTPTGVAVSATDDVWVTGYDSDNVFRITPDGVVTQMLDASGDGLGNPLSGPIDVVVDAVGNAYVAGYLSDNVFRISPAGVITEIVDHSGAGLGERLDGASAVAVDGAGHVYVAGRLTNNVLEIDPAGNISVLMYPGGDGLGATLGQPRGLAATWGGTVFVSGYTSDNVFRVTPGGVVTEIIDKAGDPISSNNDLDGPIGLAADSFGAVYVAGHLSNNVYRVDLATGAIDTLLSNTSSLGNAPRQVAVDASGRVFMSIGGDRVLRYVQPGWWADLGGSSVGAVGRPELRMRGALTQGTSIDRVLDHLPPSALTLAWISVESAPFPAVGGTVFAYPFLRQILFPADPSGQAALSFPWPPGAPSGLEVTIQFIVQDASVPDGITLSNAVQQIAP